jgi:hypothetical protein
MKLDEVRQYAKLVAAARTGYNAVPHDDFVYDAVAVQENSVNLSALIHPLPTYPAIVSALFHAGLMLHCLA